MTTLRLKKREEKRLLAGHLWVFSNEIDTTVTPLKGLEPGSPVKIESASGKFLAHAYVNPASLISARVTSYRHSRPFNTELLRERLQQALALREWRYADPYYRWVNSEGDGLPGLVVDRYDSTLVVQITTAGMEQIKDAIVSCLAELGAPAAIFLRNDNAIREMEKLPSYRDWVMGSAPDKLHIRENSLDYEVSPDSAQKTGWFYDHRQSRQQLRHWAKQRRVLDMYSYLGGFGLNAAAAAATEVLAIDASESAVAAANDNARANNLHGVFTAQAGDAVEVMRDLYNQNQKFDVVVLDPPAFIKRKKDRDAGLRHYALNNKLALRLLAPGGVLFSASCSQALDAKTLLQLIRQNLPRGQFGLQVLAPLQQAADHPINLAMPETLYLKGAIARLL